MRTPAIELEHLGKRYWITHDREMFVTLRDRVATGFRNFPSRLRFGKHRDTSKFRQREEFWALKDVSFSVKNGERVAILGRNGAGKSTLLKLLSRVTEPTTGRASITGRVASLLEVGTGFHMDLTGKENIFLNGAVLGMTRAEIRRKFDEIVAFAEVERFLDTPVKRYSSGMFVRWEMRSFRRSASGLCNTHPLPRAARFSSSATTWRRCRLSARAPSFSTTVVWWVTVPPTRWSISTCDRAALSTFLTPPWQAMTSSYAA